MRIEANNDQISLPRGQILQMCFFFAYILIGNILKIDSTKMPLGNALKL